MEEWAKKCSNGRNPKETSFDWQPQAEYASEPPDDNTSNNVGEQPPPACTSGAKVGSIDNSPSVPPQIPEKSPLVRAMSMPSHKIGVIRDEAITTSLLPPLPPRTRPTESSTSVLPPSPLQSQLSDSPPTVRREQAPIGRTVWSSKQLVVAEVTTLKGLSERPDDLPAVIRFIDGYYGHTSRFSVSAGDCFQINFLKRTRVLTFNDVKGREYTVPLMSVAKIGLLCGDAEMPLDSKTVSSILAMKRLPSVVCAQKDGKDKKGKVVVGGGDLLVIKSRKKKALHCFNLSTGSAVILQRTFEGTFTLDPEKTKMFPLEIVNHLPNVFPCKAKLYSEYAKADAQEDPLEGKTITVKGCSLDDSLVATEVQSNKIEKGNLVYFPLDQNLAKLRIEILVVDNVKHLYEDVHEMMQNFDQSVGLTYTDMGSDAAFDIQSTLLRELRPDQRNVGVELLMNKGISTLKEKGVCPRAGFAVMHHGSREADPQETASKKDTIAPNTDPCRALSSNTVQTPLHEMMKTTPANTVHSVLSKPLKPVLPINVDSSDDEYTIPDIPLPIKLLSSPCPIIVKPHKNAGPNSSINASSTPAVHKRPQSTLPQSSVYTMPPKPLKTRHPITSVGTAYESDDEYTTIPPQVKPPPVSRPIVEQHKSSGVGPVLHPTKKHLSSVLTKSSSPIPPPKKLDGTTILTSGMNKQSPRLQSHPSLPPKLEHVSSEYVFLHDHPPNDNSSVEQYTAIKDTLPQVVQPRPVAAQFIPQTGEDLQTRKENKIFLQKMNVSQVRFVLN